MSEERKPVDLAEVLQRDRMFSHDEKGNPVTRRKTCECGQSFTQRLLSERFIAIVERRGAHAISLLRQQVPDFFVPVHCPPCERTDIGMHARRASYTNYLDRPEAAD